MGQVHFYMLRATVQVSTVIADALVPNWHQSICSHCADLIIIIAFVIMPYGIYMFADGNICRG